MSFLQASDNPAKWRQDKAKAERSVKSKIKITHVNSCHYFCTCSRGKGRARTISTSLELELKMLSIADMFAVLICP